MFWKKRLKNGMFIATFKDSDISVVPLQKIFSSNILNFLISVTLLKHQEKNPFYINYQNYP